MRLRFSKWQAGGNDFILLGAQAADMAALACRELGMEMGDAARALCDRHSGVGADGLLAVQAADGADSHLRMGFWNPDGSAAGMCGNGARCFAAAAWEQGAPRNLAFQVADARYAAEPDERTGWVWLTFPQTVAVRELEDPVRRILVCRPGTDHIVVLAERASDAPGSAAAWNRLSGAGSGVGASGDGASHRGQSGGDPDEEDAWQREARGLRQNGRVLAGGGNVNLVWKEGDGPLNVLTYERGVEGFTRSCGTGAVAAALAWAAAGVPSGMPTRRLDPESEVFQAVSTPGGPLGIRYRQDEPGCSAGGAESGLFSGVFTDIQLGGPARNVFEGELDLRSLLGPTDKPHAHLPDKPHARTDAADAGAWPPPDFHSPQSDQPDANPI